MSFSNFRSNEQSEAYKAMIKKSMLKFNKQVDDLVAIGYSKLEAIELLDSIDLVSNEVVTIDHYEEVESDH